MMHYYVTKGQCDYNSTGLFKWRIPSGYIEELLCDGVTYLRCVHLYTLGSRFSFCVVSERIQASRCVADRPLAGLTVLAEPDPVTRSGKTNMGVDI